MKLSVESGTLREKVGDENALRMIKGAGFDAVDYSMCDVTEKTDMLCDDYRERARNIRKVLDEIGLICHQAHAPYLFKYSDELTLDNINFLKIVRSIEYASIIGAKHLVIHYIKNDLPENISFEEYNLNFYKAFLPYAEKFNIKISVETLYKYYKPSVRYRALLCEPQRMLEFIKKLNSKYFDICVDTGHLGLTGYAPGDVIRALGKGNVSVLHIHDIDFTNDTHTLPYLGKFDWEDITNALAKVDFNGVFSMEISGYFKKMDEKLLPHALKLAHETGRFLIDKIEMAKKGE